MSLARRLGINGHLANDRLLWDALASLRVTWVRLDINWDTAQPSIDQWDWNVIDQAVTGAHMRGINIYGSLNGTPSWANAGAGRGAPPTSIIDWTRFVRETAVRYRRGSEHGHIGVWGIWNEWQGSVGDYLNLLLQPAHEVLKTLDPENVVCGPEMATEGDWPTWLKTFLLMGGELVDVVTLHCYASSGVETWNKISRPRRWFEFWKQKSIKELISETRYVGKPCWITETGIQSEVVGEEGQARYWDEILERLAGTHWPAGVLVYQLVDEPHVTFGVFREDHSPKPVVNIIKKYTQGVA